MALPDKAEIAQKGINLCGKFSRKNHFNNSVLVYVLQDYL